MAQGNNTDYDMDYDEYEQMEATAEELANASLNKSAIPQQKPINRATQVTPEEEVRRVEARVGKIKAPAAPKKTPEQEMAELEQETAAETESSNAEVQQVEESGKMPKWVPFHQPEKIGLINTETREMIEGFKDEGSATGMAKILNELDVLIIGGGYQ